MWETRAPKHFVCHFTLLGWKTFDKYTRNQRSLQHIQHLSTSFHLLWNGCSCPSGVALVNSSKYPGPCRKFSWFSFKFDSLIWRKLHRWVSHSFSKKMSSFRWRCRHWCLLHHQPVGGQFFSFSHFSRIFVHQGTRSSTSTPSWRWCCLTILALVASHSPTICPTFTTANVSKIFPQLVFHLWPRGRR